MDWQRIQTVEKVFDYYTGMPLYIVESQKLHCPGPLTSRK
jgi:hypothetical protein